MDFLVLEQPAYRWVDRYHLLADRIQRAPGP
jgi:hypothetical protein